MKVEGKEVEHIRENLTLDDIIRSVFNTAQMWTKSAMRGNATEQDLYNIEEKTVAEAKKEILALLSTKEEGIKKIFGNFLLDHREVWSLPEWSLIRTKWFKLEEEFDSILCGKKPAEDYINKIGDHAMDTVCKCKEPMRNDFTPQCIVCGKNLPSSEPFKEVCPYHSKCVGDPCATGINICDNPEHNNEQMKKLCKCEEIWNKIMIKERELEIEKLAKIIQDHFGYIDSWMRYISLASKIMDRDKSDN